MSTKRVVVVAGGRAHRAHDVLLRKAPAVANRANPRCVRVACVTDPNEGDCATATTVGSFASMKTPRWLGGAFVQLGFELLLLRHSRVGQIHHDHGYGADTRKVHSFRSSQTLHPPTASFVRGGLNPGRSSGTNNASRDGTRPSASRIVCMVATAWASSSGRKAARAY